MRNAGEVWRHSSVVCSEARTRATAGHCSVRATNSRCVVLSTLDFRCPLRHRLHSPQVGALRAEAQD